MRHKALHHLLLLSAILLPTVTVAAQSPEQRADALIKKMTLEEKIEQLHGLNSTEHERIVPGVERLNIPPLPMANGPAGIGPTDVVQPHATAYPAPLAVAASWDRKEAMRYGKFVADEVIAIGRSMLEAPSVNISRVPTGGRAFEGYGEDPLLAAEIAVANINGVQSLGVLANIKHYALNNQEQDRLTVSAEADERTMREIYLPAFEAAVKRANVASLMCAYNKVNGAFACTNKFLMNDVLRRDWGFNGFVVSDFGAAHDAVADAEASMDLEMPKGDTYNAEFLDKVRKGIVPESRIDEMLRHRYATMIRLGLFDKPLVQHPLDKVGGGNAAREIAAHGMVLLKNDHQLLPLDSKKKQSIALIGPAVDQLLEGGGAAFVLPLHTITPEEGMRARFGADRIRVVGVGGAGMIDRRETVDGYALSPANSTSSNIHGVHAEYFDNMELKGNPKVVRDERIPEMRTEFGAPFNDMLPQFSLRWTANLHAPVSGDYTLGFEMWGRMRLWLDGKLLLDLSKGPNSLQNRTTTVHLEAGHEYALKAEYISTARGVARILWQMPEKSITPAIAEAVAAARTSDVAVVFAGTWAHEGFDATTLQLSDQQNALIDAVATANPHTIVVLQTGTPVLMPWLNKVAGVLEAWFPGEEGGAAIASILAGDINPSGKLPITFPASDKQVPANTVEQYPGVKGVVYYSEKLKVGYRWYNSEHQQPLFPFGFGLSYTNYAFSHLKINKQANGHVDVAVEVANQGTRDGDEVVQLYVDYPTNCGEPPMQLRGFEKIALKAGEHRQLHFDLDARAFSIWSTNEQKWKIVPGSYGIAVGDSSRHLPLRGLAKLQ